MDYLSAHPRACDTPVGIATWWLQRQKVMRGLEQVNRALQLLERHGQVVRLVQPDGSVLYSIKTDEKYVDRR